MKVELTDRMRELLRDPESRRQLQSVLAGGRREIRLGDKAYELIGIQEESIV